MSGVVVDTSVWIDFLRGRPTPELENALRQSLVLLPPLVVSELVSGAREKQSRQLLLDLLVELPIHETDLPHWIRVGELRGHCLQNGLSVSTPDAHVAQCTLDVDGVLLSHDKIFHKIAGITDLRLSGAGDLSRD